jgi:ketosteroid isomerase-like protein
MVINTNALDFVDCIERYLAALERSDFDSIVALFDAQATVTSPFLGRVAPKPFYDKVAGVTTSSKAGRPELFVSASGSRRAIGYFNYGWLLKDGTQVGFQCADVFEFTRDGRIAELSIVYDTEPVRRLVGDKYR